MKIWVLTFTHACSRNPCTKFHTLSFMNNWEKSGVLPIGFSSFGVKLSFLASIILDMLCYRAFSIWFGFINTSSFSKKLYMLCSGKLNMCYRTSLGKYWYWYHSSDGPASINVSFLNDDRTSETWLFKYLIHWESVCIYQCAFSSAVMSTELEVSIYKNDKVFFKRLQLFFDLFVREKGKLHLNTKGAFHTFSAVTSGRSIC